MHPPPEDPVLARRRLRIALRRLRRERDLTQRHVADELEWSLSKLIRVESGAQGISVTDLQAVLDLYRLDDAVERETLRAAARASRGRAWWARFESAVPPAFAQYLAYEGSATAVLCHQPSLLPGLLQTPAYTAALPTDPLPVAGGAALRGELRRERMKRLRRPGGPRVSFLIDEAAVRRAVGGATVMTEQLEHLVQMAAAPDLDVAVLPFAAGAHPLVDQPCSLLELEEGDVLFVESAATGDRCVRDEPALVARYQERFAAARELALTGTDAASLIRSVHEALAAGRP
ncbi:DUF5753 domain-containing protein [Streptomyces spiramenti]|uniref:Helix-turn-helix domain-containing protein n=1 Tax=Streptomyces spiramenti TaxID=2720606 RepID=A0ABX1APX8_9ACTN|nr:DUF5753 domain-containing protein [Streptomyces spiramenti]NJP68350.1 helix-turn-helix domain-containing protein [Streptomyces spiramenti]